LAGAGLVSMNTMLLNHELNCILFFEYKLAYSIHCTRFVRLEVRAVRNWT